MPTPASSSAATAARGSKCSRLSCTTTVLVRTQPSPLLLTTHPSLQLYTAQLPETHETRLTPGIDEQSVPVAVAPFRKGLGTVQPPPEQTSVSVKG